MNFRIQSEVKPSGIQVRALICEINFGQFRLLGSPRVFLQPRYVLLIASLACYPVFAKDYAVQAELIHSGIFQSDKIRTRWGVDLVENIEAVSGNKEIEGKLGVEFGILYELQGVHTRKKMKLKRVLRVPQPGLPEEGTELIDYVTLTAGKESYFGYGFDYSYEIIEGEWIFEIWYREKRLLLEKFSVLIPEDAK